MDRYWIGATVRARVWLTDADGAPIDATDVAITARNDAPGAAPIQGSVRPGGATGAYYADFAVAEAGIWTVRAACTAPVAAAVEDRFEVRPSLVL